MTPYGRRNCARRIASTKPDLVRLEAHKIAAPAAGAASLQQQQQQDESVNEKVSQLTAKVNTLTSKVDFLTSLVVGPMGSVDKFVKPMNVPLDDEDEP